ncbi:MAG: GNAT family N-acetyltransferase [Gammaproteobacteria bacterium]|nr:GNAT family N-acetyltransferase [Gammaproteobacteria bacterium]
MIEIREFENADWPATWAILEPVFRQGKTYSFAADMSEAEAQHVWVKAPEETFVAENNSGEILGTYFIKPNQPGQGDHVCNCGYVVAESARGQGIASKMCEHSQAEAMKRGYRAMQYNLVVATNSDAVRLWQKLGFEIIGTLPEAFRHPGKGYVDAHIMYKLLKS